MSSDQQQSKPTSADEHSVLRYGYQPKTDKPVDPKNLVPPKGGSYIHRPQPPKTKQ